MNKEEWKESLKKMEGFLKVAKGNVKSAQSQVEELEFNIFNYKKKIKEL